MSDEYTEVTTEGYFSRLGGSIIGVLIGFLLVPASLILLYLNEGRAVTALVALEQGARQVVEISAGKLDATANGKLIHLSGDLTAQDPAKDTVFGVSGAGLVRLQRNVEMFQWREDKQSDSHENVGGSKTTETTYIYRREWAPGPVNSNSFHHPEGHGNPQMPVGSTIFDGSGVKIGAYRLGPTILSQVTAFTTVDPGAATPPQGYRRDGGGLYRGNDPANPAIGDMRVHFDAVQPQPYSVVAALATDALNEYRGPDDYTIALAAPGAVSADQLFRAKKSEENTLTWILRGVGFVVVLIGFLLIARPVSMVLAFLPFLEGIAEAGAFLVALMLAIPLTFIVIAIAWIAHRPLIGGIMLAGAIGSFVLVRMLHPRRAAAG
jgi:Transmembrane protein 43